MLLPIVLVLACGFLLCALLPYVIKSPEVSTIQLIIAAVALVVAALIALHVIRPPT